LLNLNLVYNKQAIGQVGSQLVIGTR